MTLEERAAMLARDFWDPEMLMTYDVERKTPIRALVIGRLVRDAGATVHSLEEESRFFGRMAEMAREVARQISGGSSIVMADERIDRWVIRCAMNVGETERILLENFGEGDDSADFADAVEEGVFWVGIVVCWAA